jgi:hypothetical protein
MIMVGGFVVLLAIVSVIFNVKLICEMVLFNVDKVEFNPLFIVVTLTLVVFMVVLGAVVSFNDPIIAEANPFIFISIRLDDNKKALTSSSNVPLSRVLPRV